MFHKYGKLFPTRIILFILCHKYIQPWLRYFSRNIWHCCISIYYHPLIISCSGIGNQCSVGKPKVVGITRRNTVSILSYTFELRCYIIKWPLIKWYGNDGVDSNIKLVIISLWIIRFRPIALILSLEHFTANQGLKSYLKYYLHLNHWVIHIFEIKIHDSSFIINHNLAAQRAVWTVVNVRLSFLCN